MEILMVIGIIFGIGYVFGKSGSSSQSSHRNKAQYNQRAITPALRTKLNVKKGDISSIVLSQEQKAVFNLIENTMINAYVTGKAGTGKSILLQYFVENTEKNVAVVAPTGVAALNVGGQTIHSFFKLAPELQDLSELRVDYKTKEILRHLDTLVIDEISMVRADLMEAINVKLQLARGNDMPFGGVQVVMFGDLFQLPPVVNDGQLRRYFDHNYGGIYFFNAPVYRKTELKVFELDHIFRQEDENFKKILNAVRNGQDLDDALITLNGRANVKLPEGGFITLAGNNSVVSKINHHKLSSLPTNVKVYEAEITGDLKESAFPTEKNLKLKVGAQVMLLKNDRQKPSRWVNGTLGIVTRLSDEIIKVNIDGVDHSISKETWNSVRYYYDHENRKLEKEIVSSFTQFPLRLAWALTIHKSQGQTYQSVAIDLSEGAFAHGQTYVALSRCVSLEGLYLVSSIRREDIIVDQEVVEFMKNVTILEKS
jgi:ATP-dependent DNA helicase PIF1